MGVTAAIVGSAVIGGAVASNNASKARKQAQEQARAINAAAERTAQQSRETAAQAQRQQESSMARAAAQDKARAAEQAALAKAATVEVDIGEPGAGEDAPSRKRAKFQTASDPSASIRI